MDEDSNIQGTESEDSAEEEPRVTAGAAIAVFVAGVVAVALAIYFGVAQTVAGLFFVVGIPLVLLWFVWNVFLRRLWRIRRIRNAQERRELMEAAMRDNDRNHEEH
jgi:membrane protein YdbS with pleckstrin-like domain